jgi:transketolase
LLSARDVAGRFLAYGWHVQRVSDANDRERVADAIAVGKRIDDRPSLIIIASHLGYGAPHKQDTSGAHGEPLGEAEVKLAKRSYGWPEDAQFLVPEGVYEHFAKIFGVRGKKLRRSGWRCSSATAPPIRNSPINASGCSGAISRRGGTGTSRYSPPI